MNKIVFFTLLSFIALGLNAQVHLTNKSSKPIYVALAYYRSSENYNGWFSEGWWRIIPGETKVLGNFIHDGDNTYYIHAHSEDNSKSWGNDVNLAVNAQDAFEILNCDKSYVLEDGLYTTKKFTKHSVHIGLLDVYEAYLSLTD
ncbi:MAG: DUF1036 domain-containing protein [Flavobacteriia bacterium]|nr:DUF1036 domain-containing protein [Flavobacteriia bacterium]